MKKHRNAGEGNPNYKYSFPKEILVRLYKKEKKSIKDIMQLLGCANKPIIRLMKKYNISPRKLSAACRIGKTGKYKRTEDHRKIIAVATKTRFLNNPIEREKYRQRAIGNKNPNWHGGIYKEEYGKGFGNQLKEEIRCRDYYKCCNCGLDQVDNNGKQLDIHHIDYDKHNHLKKNLISLCKRCHMKTSYKRTFWLRKFQKYMKGR
jgi:hypothetical protein